MSQNQMPNQLSSQHTQEPETQSLPAESQSLPTQQPEANLPESVLVVEDAPEVPAEAHPGHAEPHHHMPDSASIKALKETLKQHPEPEKKLELAIQFMATSLAQTGSPHFRDFWEAKKICQELFKENINSTSRVHLWATYSELSREARRLKEIFDEQSAFACEQIEIAVKAIEDELLNFDEFLKNSPGLKFAAPSYSLEENYETYNKLQRELELLNVCATRVNSLRKELIKTEMRIREKNKFFERLSKLGDQIFPRRKALIQEVSTLFMQDVEKFIKNTFDHELKTAALFSIREEIKALQSNAKQLTLNTDAFSKTRTSLSECWDSIKNLIVDKKKQEHEQRQEFKQHREEHLTSLEALKKKCEAKEVTEHQAYDELEHVIQLMRKSALGRQEIRVLREKVTEVREFIAAHLRGTSNKPNAAPYTGNSSERRQSGSYSAAKAQAVSNKDAQHEKEQAKIRAYEALQNKIQEALVQAESSEIDALTASYDALVKEIALSQAGRMQKLSLEKGLHQLRDRILEKREKKLLSLSKDDRQALEQLNTLLQERKAQRQEIKNLLETHRKSKGTSSFDFAEALQANELVAAEKARLEKIETAIEEIEDQIATFEGE